MVSVGPVLLRRSSASRTHAGALVVAVQQLLVTAGLFAFCQASLSPSPRRDPARTGNSAVVPSAELRRAERVHADDAAVIMDVMLPT